jgi:hypothetical protein
LHHKRRHTPDESLIVEEFEFPITNMDICIDGLRIWVEHENLGSIDLGQTHFIKALAGDHLSLKTSEGKTLMIWRVRPYQTQLEASKMYIKKEE